MSRIRKDVGKKLRNSSSESLRINQKALELEFSRPLANFINVPDEFNIGNIKEENSNI